MYNFKLPEETGWAGVSTAVGGLVAAILSAVGVDSVVTVSAGIAAGSFFRFFGAMALARFGVKVEEPAAPPAP